MDKPNSILNKKQRSIPILYLRGLAALFIFACHVAFISGAFELSMWLNAGVPMFFIISAYLLALKPNISQEPLTFYRRRGQSIFPSYWIYLICAAVLLFIIGKGPNLYSIASFGTGMFGFAGGVILGMGHLWFITVLIVCYLITPALHKLCVSTCGVKFMILSAIILVAQFLLFFFVGRPSYGMHIGTYIGVYCFYNKVQGEVTPKQIIIWALIAIATSVVRFALDADIRAGDPKLYYYDGLFLSFARFSCAMLLFTVFIYFSHRIEYFSVANPRKHKVISRFSDISYEFYLTHQFILLAIWEFVPELHSGIGLVIWILVSFIATIFNTIALIRIKSLITNKLIHKS